MWSRVAKAKTPDDIDPVFDRISKDIFITKESNSEDIYSLSDYDSKELNKIGANRYIGGSVCGGYSMLSGATERFSSGLGFVASFDSRSMIYNFNAEGYFSGVGISYVNIQAMYPFSSGKISPYLSAAMGFGGINANIKRDNDNYENFSESGLLIFVGGGYIFNRTSDVSLRVNANFYLPAFELDNKLPIGFLLSTSLLFGR